MFRILIIITITCVQATAVAQNNGDWLGSERGPYLTGTIQEVWIDKARNETATSDPNDKRHLTIQLWYPAQDTDGAPRAAYASSIKDYDDFVQKSWGKAATRLTHSYVDAALSDKLNVYPVILYSHGFGEPSFSGTYQTEFLASHGYIVVSIGHTGTDGRILFPGNYRYEPVKQPPKPASRPKKKMTYIEMYHQSVKDPVIQSRHLTALKDISYVIDSLKRINGSPDSRFYQHIDMTRTGGLGFSNGGANYFQATITEPRLVAVANMDGSLNGLSVLTEGARKPVLLVQASNNYPRVYNGPADAGMEEFFTEVVREKWRMLRLSTGDWYNATIEGTQHPYFSDAYLIVPPPKGVIDPVLCHELVNKITLEFFDKYLKGSDNTPIMDHRKTFKQLRLVSKLVKTDKKNPE